MAYTVERKREKSSSVGVFNALIMRHLRTCDAALGKVRSRQFESSLARALHLQVILDAAFTEVNLLVACVHNCATTNISKYTTKCGSD